MTRPYRFCLISLIAALGLVGCDALDTSALREIEETAQAARLTVEDLNTRAADVQGAINDPLGTLQAAALGATFTKIETAEPNLFVLTDLQTGCQWLATYDGTGKAISLLPRTEPVGDATRQRCVIVDRLSGNPVDPGEWSGG